MSYNGTLLDLDTVAVLCSFADLCVIVNWQNSCINTYSMHNCHLHNCQNCHLSLLLNKNISHHMYQIIKIIIHWMKLYEKIHIFACDNGARMVDVFPLRRKGIICHLVWFVHSLENPLTSPSAYCSCGFPSNSLPCVFLVFAFQSRLRRDLCHQLFLHRRQWVWS